MKQPVAPTDLLCSPRFVVGSARPPTLTVAIALLLTGLCTYHGVRAALHTKMGLANDWGVYYLAGGDMRAGGDIYNLRNGPLLTFKNAPVVALAMEPMSLLPPMAARTLWMLMDGLLVVGILWMSLRLLFRDGVPPARGEALGIGVAAAGLTLNYLLNQSRTGQITLLFLSLTVLSFYLASRNHMAWAGAALAAAVCLKIVPICFLPYLLLRKGAHKAAAGFAGALAVLLLLPALWIGWNHNLDLLTRWPHHLHDTQSREQATRFQNLSVQAMVARLVSPTIYDSQVIDLSSKTAEIAGLAIMTVVGGLLYAFLYLTMDKGDPGPRNALHLSLLLIYMTIFNPLAWRYNFVALLVPYVFCVSSCWQKSKSTGLILTLLGITCALTWVPRMDGFRTLDWPQVIGVRTWAAILLAATCMIHGIRNGGCNPFGAMRPFEAHRAPATANA